MCLYFIEARCFFRHYFLLPGHCQILVSLLLGFRQIRLSPRKVGIQGNISDSLPLLKERGIA